MILPVELGTRLLRLSLLYLFAGTAGWLCAQGPPWTAKPIAAWTEQDARQVLEASPWAKTVIPSTTRRQTETERREGGQMGQPHGIGYDGIDDRIFHPEALGNPLGGAPLTGPPAPVFRLLVRWESALPVRVAELKLRESPPPRGRITDMSSPFTEYPAETTARTRSGWANRSRISAR